MKPVAALSALVLAGLLAVPAVQAQDKPADLSDPVSVRQHMMKNVGGAMKLAAPMAKGEAPFDARVALAAFRTMNAAALGFGSQFPEGSDVDLTTEAAPKIWEDAAGFDTAVAKFVADTEAAIAAAPADLDAFKAAFGAVAANCKGCHETYRIKKN